MRTLVECIGRESRRKRLVGGDKHVSCVPAVIKRTRIVAECYAPISVGHPEPRIQAERPVVDFDSLYEAPDFVELIGEIRQDLALPQFGQLLKAIVPDCAPEGQNLFLTFWLFPGPNI